MNDPRNVRLTTKITPGKSLAPDDVLAKVKEVLNWYVSDSACRGDLTRGGIFLSVVQEAVRFTVPGFQPLRFGFAKFSEYLQYACKGSPLCIARPLHSQAVLAFRNAVRSDVEILPDIDVRDLQTADGYRSLLATGTPVIRLPPAGELLAIAGWICQFPPERADLGSIIEGAVGGLNGAISSEAARLGILSLVSAQAFEREPEGISLSEQKLSLQLNARTPEGLLALVRNAARTKLIALLGQVRDDVLQQALGETAEPIAAADDGGM
ncbi:MAG: hypothetical protein KF868_08960 [Acidobacteria bacterium]|nr:hypothetical protein [Acidobacteriota bacterium]MCW5971159.1 hypothetical protein [Blastocatellales bacterium]